MKKALVILAVMLAARCLPAQGTGTNSWAPLVLSTNGAGGITPYSGGQILQVGQPYSISAIPNRGGRFVIWYQVKKTVEVKTVIYPSEAFFISTNTTVSSRRYSRRTQIQILMEPYTVQVRDDHPGTSVITQSVEWQANFSGGKTP